MKSIAVVAALLVSAPAQAATMEFSFEFRVIGTVVPVVTPIVSGQGYIVSPHVDPDAAGGGLNGFTRITLGGRYDSAWVRTNGATQSVTTSLTASSDTFGTVIAPYQATLMKSANGEISLRFVYPSIFAGNHPITLFDRTVFSATVAPPGGGGKIGTLTPIGDYDLRNPTISNFYGIQPYQDPLDFSYFGGEYYYNYLTFGANRLDGRGDANGAGVGRDSFSLYIVPDAPPPLPGSSSVPEPTMWGMMMLGMGVVGAAMRRGKARATQAKWLRVRGLA